jgi:hypothetical protein
VQKSDFKDFSLSLTAVAELYGKSISEAAMALWWQALKRFDVDQVRRALTMCVESPESGQFMPKPADVIRACEGTASDRGLLAWGQVFDAMASVGAYKSVQFQEPAIHAAIVDIGGWVKLCRTSNDEVPFVQRRFLEAYRVYTQRGAEGAPVYLTGESEQANVAANRLTHAERVLIGERKEQPRRIAAQGEIA